MKPKCDILLSTFAFEFNLRCYDWERLDIDPFFTPRTAEEREEFGEDGRGLHSYTFQLNLSRF